jgi:2-phosphoglycolate phosphatase
MGHNAILFDLDGTLLDTAPALGKALNTVFEKHNKPKLPNDIIRNAAGYGSFKMLSLHYDLKENSTEMIALKNEFFDIYLKDPLYKTIVFQGIEKLITKIEALEIPWGIVTNRLQKFCEPLLVNFEFLNKAKCIVFGDSTDKRKPHPKPLLLASQQLNLPPAELIYVGDVPTDIIAARNAGMTAASVLYGYANKDDHTLLNEADICIQDPLEICQYFTTGILHE